MTTTVSAPAIEALEREFREACEEFARARASRRVKDTPAARRHVEESLALVDAALDRGLETSLPRATSIDWAV
jgi:hypothetical protein